MSNGSGKDGGKTVIRPGFSDPFGSEPPARGGSQGGGGGGGNPWDVGGPTPPASAPKSGGGAGAGRPASSPTPPSGGGFGGSAGGIGAPKPAPLPSGGGGGQRTVIGGALPVTPAPMPQYNPSPNPGQPAPGNWMGAQAKSDSFFPDAQRAAPPPRAAPTRKIRLEVALNAPTGGHSAEANPMTAAAASLLILFGRLRSQVVEMQAVPLMNHVTEEIERAERRMLELGVDPQDAMIAKYCICGTADDIVQNLPGTDRAVWLQYSMVARFFNKRTSGVGFFQEVDKALQDPMRKYNILELMLTCLSLGFEGQYRAMPGGELELQRVRRKIFETLRRVKPRGDDDISPRWKPVEVAARRSGARTPVWVIGILALAVLSGAYITMRMLLAEDGNGLGARMTTLHPSEPVKINRLETVTAYIAPVVTTAQIDRIREGLAAERDAGLIKIDTRGDYFFVGVNNLVLFESGKADTKPEFTPLGEKIAATLNAEPGPIRIIGHTDNVPLSGRGRFKNNFELSVGRAQSVATVIQGFLGDPSRVVVEGKGEDEPITDNSTPEGRAENRRVEIMIQREETLAGGAAAVVEETDATGTTTP